MFDRPPSVDHGLSVSPNASSSAMAMLSDLDFYLSEDLQSSGSASTTTGRCSPARKSSFSNSLANSKSSSRTLLAVLGEVCDRCSAAISPLLSAVQLGHTNCLRPLLRSGALDLGNDCTASGVTAVHIASKRGDLEALTLLLDYDRTSVNFRDERGACGGHIAAYQGEVECLTALVRVGGCEQRTYDGATPAHFAAAGGHLEALKVLEKANMEANATTKSGATPVYFAAQEGHTDCVQWLVETAGANPTLASADGMTPLHAAAQTGRLNAMTWLVRKAECDLLCRTSDGATPVHFAAAKGHVHILTWLLYQKLCTGLEEDDYGASPVHDAAEQGQLESLRVFASHRVRMFSTDSEGLTPLDLAEQHGHISCARFLKSMSSRSSVSAHTDDDDGASSSGTDSHSVNTLENDVIAPVESYVAADGFFSRSANSKEMKRKRSKWSLAKGIKRKLSRDHTS